MIDLAQRLGVAPQHVDRFHELSAPQLADPDTLLDKAFALGPADPEGAQAMLAAAILSGAQRISDGRHAAALALLAPLVGQANPDKTLGEAGAHVRSEVMPNGWRYTLGSWDRLRYAWREGLEDLLDVDPEDAGIVNALNEVTRLTPAEPEPVKVAIQEQFPHPKVAFLVTMIGFTFTGYGLFRGATAAATPRRRRR